MINLKKFRVSDAYQKAEGYPSSEEDVWINPDHVVSVEVVGPRGFHVETRGMTIIWLSDKHVIYTKEPLSSVAKRLAEGSK